MLTLFCEGILSFLYTPGFALHIFVQDFCIYVYKKCCTVIFILIMYLPGFKHQSYPYLIKFWDVFPYFLSLNKYVCDWCYVTCQR